MHENNIYGWYIAKINIAHYELVKTFSNSIKQGKEF